MPRTSPPTSQALIGELQYEEAAEFPVERGYVWTTRRRSRTATRCSGTTPSPTSSPAVRSRRRRCSRRGSAPTTGRPGAPSEKLPLQIHFDLKERFELPEAIMSDNTIVFHEPVRPGDVHHQRAESCVR